MCEILSEAGKELKSDVVLTPAKFCAKNWKSEIYHLQDLR